MLAVNDSIITNEKKIASILNDHYINIVEKSRVKYKNIYR